MATVRSLSLRGKTVNVPHTEHRVVEDSDKREKNSVSFNADGTAEVSNTMAEALVQFYPSQISIVELDKEKAPVAKKKAPAKTPRK